MKLNTLYSLQIELAATVSDLLSATTIKAKRRHARRAQAIRRRIREV
jgi:hypothetical protein